MFKRREKLPLSTRLRSCVWPQSGWSRAWQYLRLRMSRIPDTPNRIALGIAVGVFVSFTPFFGAHMPLAIVLAWVLRANIIGALLGTFAGNPLTFPVIAFCSMETGRHILGEGAAYPGDEGFTHMFARAAADLWYNFFAVFNAHHTNWGAFLAFVDKIVVPYMVGGVLIGGICAGICFWLTRSAVATYQTRRRARVRTKFQKQHDKADAHRR